MCVPLVLDCFRGPVLGHQIPKASIPKVSRWRPLGTVKNNYFVWFLGGPQPPPNPLPGAQNRPPGPRNGVPKPIRSIPGWSTIFKIFKKIKNEPKGQVRLGREFPPRGGKSSPRGGLRPRGARQSARGPCRIMMSPSDGQVGYLTGFSS